MKTEREIREKIDEYMDKLEVIKRRSFVINGGGEIANIYGIIDALLWVIGDESGLRL